MADGTVIANCNCKNDYQEEKYGKSKRVHTLQGNNDQPKPVCTSCGKVKGAQEKSKKK